MGLIIYFIDVEKIIRKINNVKFELKYWKSISNLVVILLIVSELITTPANAGKTTYFIIRFNSPLMPNFQLALLYCVLLFSVLFIIKILKGNKNITNQSS